MNVDAGEQVFVGRDGGENVLQGSAEGYLEVSMQWPGGCGRRRKRTHETQAMARLYIPGVRQHIAKVVDQVWRLSGSAYCVMKVVSMVVRSQIAGNGHGGRSWMRSTLMVSAIMWTLS